MLWRPRKILIEDDVAGYSVTESVLAHWPQAPVEYTRGIKAHAETLGADDLVVARQRGRFIKKCPGTPAYTCCDYYVFNLGIGCRFNCAYCYLHHYMNTPFTIYANTDDLITEARDFFGRRPNRAFRVGSGEFIDSVDFDEMTGTNRLLVPAMTDIPNVIFEIKTKTDRIERLLDLDHRGRVVISWSLNPESVTTAEEHGAAPLMSRLAAAAACATAGFRIGFHFDPLIHHPGWEGEYDNVVEELFSHVPADKIAWISLGALRFNPGLKPIIERDFPESRLTTGELVRGLDGKLRYFIAVRRKMFRRLNSVIRSFSPEVPVYLCMENKKLADEVGVKGLDH